MLYIMKNFLERIPNSKCKKNAYNINGSSWILNHGFNFITQNPFANKVCKKDAIIYFAQNTVNFTRDVSDYKVPAAAGTDMSVLDSLKLISFVREKLEKEENIYLFNKQEKLDTVSTE